MIRKRVRTKPLPEGWHHEDHPEIPRLIYKNETTGERGFIESKKERYSETARALEALINGKNPFEGLVKKASV
ncbi:MAG: hypothetical protein KAW41_00905 [Candidatus Diapherotrites archaeon]|nr:hypothetical protein [Candidatus Diapherotrites archaeon]